MSKSKGKSSTIKNPKEAVESIIHGVRDHTVDEGLRKSAEDFWAQITGNLGPDHNKVHARGDTSTTEESHAEESHQGETISLSGMLNPGEWLNLSGVKDQSHQEEAKPEVKKNSSPGLDYHREMATTSERTIGHKQTEMERKFQSIKQELDRMVQSSNKVIQDEFGGVTLEQAPAQVGDYHINFLDWMLITIRNARQKVEDSGAWLSAMRSKKGQRGYTSMSKKHGTSFTMSNERQVATQTG